MGQAKPANNVNYSKNQHWERACALTQQRLSTILIKMEAQRPWGNGFPSRLLRLGHIHGNPGALKTHGSSLGAPVTYTDAL